RAGPAGGRYADQRRNRVLDPVPPRVVGDRAGIGQYYPRAFGAVHRTAAPDADEPVAAVLAVERRCLGDVGRRRVRLCVSVDSDLEPRSPRVVGDGVDDPGSRYPGVGDDEGPGPAEP